MGIKDEKTLYFIEVKNQQNIYRQNTINKLNEIVTTVDSNLTSFLVSLDNSKKEKIYIEIKKFNTIAEKYLNSMQSTEEKLNDIGQKVKDALALIVGINCTDNSSEDFVAYKQILCCDKPNIKVILWNESDWVRPISNRRNALINQLKKKLLWLTNSVSVTSTQNNHNNSGFTVNKTEE